MKLKISDDLSLPLDAATRRMAVLAMSGAGKSNVAVVLAEAMYDAGIPWVAIDPKGDWYGVRSSSDGKSAGLPIPIFGGLHGDFPLEPSAGAYVAGMIVDRRLTCVLDVSEFAERQQMFRFLRDLGETLLRRNREALHLFLEECDDYIPQSASEKGELPRCKGVWQRVVKRGRFRGIGSTQISQRSATIDKDTLYQAEILFALRATGKGDRKAVEGWVEHHSAAKEIVESLPTLRDGEGWVSSPAWLRQTKRLQFSRRRTFDSGATPVLAHGKRAPVATMADINVPEVTAAMAESIERDRANDPVVLRKEIAELKRQLAAKPAPAAPPKPERVEVHALTDAQIARIERAAKTVADAIERATEARAKALEREAVTVGPANSILTELAVVVRKLRNGYEAPRPAVVAPRSTVSRSAAPAQAQRPPKAARPLGGDPTQLPPVEQKILDELAELDSIGVPEPDKTQLALFCGYTNPRSGGFTEPLGRLMGAGLVVYPRPGYVALDERGRSVARAPGGVTTTRDLQDRLLRKLDGPRANIVRELIKLYPNPIDKTDLAARLGYTNPRSGGFTEPLGSLRALGLIGYPSPGRVVALPVLFLEGR